MAAVSLQLCTTDSGVLIMDARPQVHKMIAMSAKYDYILAAHFTHQKQLTVAQVIVLVRNQTLSEYWPSPGCEVCRLLIHPLLCEYMLELLNKA